MHNYTGVNGSWNQIKEKLKEQFALLTENDLLYAEGRKEEMLERIRLKLGKTKEELAEIIAAL